MICPQTATGTTGKYGCGCAGLSLPKRNARRALRLRDSGTVRVLWRAETLHRRSLSGGRLRRRRFVCATPPASIPPGRLRPPINGSLRNGGVRPNNEPFSMQTVRLLSRGLSGKKPAHRIPADTKAAYRWRRPDLSRQPKKSARAAGQIVCPHILEVPCRRDHANGLSDKLCRWS